MFPAVLKRCKMTGQDAAINNPAAPQVRWLALPCHQRSHQTTWVSLCEASPTQLSEKFLRKKGKEGERWRKKVGVGRRRRKEGEGSGKEGKSQKTVKHIIFLNCQFFLSSKWKQVMI